MSELKAVGKKVVVPSCSFQLANLERKRLQKTKTHYGNFTMVTVVGASVISVAVAVTIIGFLRIVSPGLVVWVALHDGKFFTRVGGLFGGVLVNMLVSR